MAANSDGSSSRFLLMRSGEGRRQGEWYRWRSGSKGLSGDDGGSRVEGGVGGVGGDGERR